MPSRVRFTHTELASGQHAITSPDVKGFCIVGAPGQGVSEVERQAIDALLLLKRRDSGLLPSVAAIEFTAA